MYSEEVDKNSKKLVVITIFCQLRGRKVNFRVQKYSKNKLIVICIKFREWKRRNQREHCKKINSNHNIVCLCPSHLSYWDQQWYHSSYLAHVTPSCPALLGAVVSMPHYGLTDQGLIPGPSIWWSAYPAVLHISLVDKWSWENLGNVNCGNPDVTLALIPCHTGPWVCDGSEPARVGNKASMTFKLQ